MMSRRQFVVGAGSAALLAGCGRWQGQAQQPAVGGMTLRRIGVLGDVPAARWDAFREGLRELGWVEGQNLAVEYRWAEGNPERRRALTAELVELNVECIAAGTRAAAAAAKQVTATVPIVAILATGEALEHALVDNIARPGGNITGMAGISGVDLEGKQLQLLKETVPRAARVALLGRETVAGVELRLQALESAAATLGVQVQFFSVEHPRALADAFLAMSAAGADALKILANVLFDPVWPEIADLAARHQLPAIAERIEFPRVGGLMAYGVNLLDIYRRAATYVDKLLKGARPGELPMERPMRFDFGVNLKTARELGLTFPETILLQATEAIQ